MTTYYGFIVSNRDEQPAWFCSLAAADRFNDACGGELGVVKTTKNPAPADVLDTLDSPWGRDEWKT
jgi:hypothetical protein